MLSTKEIMDYVQGTETVRNKKHFGFAEAKEIGDVLGVPWDKFGVEQFRMGLNIELGRGRRDPVTNVTYDEPMGTGRIALAHLKEIPNYYSQLAEAVMFVLEARENKTLTPLKTMELSQGSTLL